jgi:hypothetical protein
VELLAQSSTLGLGGLEDPVALAPQGVAEPRSVDDGRDQRDDGVEELSIGPPERRLASAGAGPQLAELLAGESQRDAGLRGG